MRISSMSLISNEEEPLRFDLRNVESKSPFLVRAVVGIDADVLIPKFYGFSRDGNKKFYDIGLKDREIVIRIVLNPRFHLDEDHSYVRDQLYRTILGTRTGLLELQFHSGATTTARTYGFITKFEVPHFSKTPEVQITIRCTDPMLRGLTPTIYDSTELPSTNPIVIADSTSTAPHGFHMDFIFTATTPEFIIQDKETNPDWIFKISPPTDFLAGDVLHLSSEFTNKFLYMIRSGVTTHLMDRVEPSSIWPIIFPGFNQFWFNQIASFDWGSIEYDSAYWGV